MTLTSEQESGIDRIGQWLKDTNAWDFRLGGFAGTGKTFLLSHLINNHDKKVICCAPTGKAASVLQTRLDGYGVTTVHSALYDPVDPSYEKLHKLEKRLESSKSKKEQSEITLLIENEKQRLMVKDVQWNLKSRINIEPGDLVAIDESSMVTKRMRDDLRQTGAKVLFVGDPGQLPPVGDDGWFFQGQLDHVLQSVQRQAMNSPIIRMSMDVRNDAFKAIDYQTDPTCCVIGKSDAVPELYMEADQIITGKNFTRHSLNRELRKRKGFESRMPVANEKLIILKNERFRGLPIRNGIQCVSMNDTVIDKNKGSYKINLDYEGIELNNVEFYDFHCRSNYINNLIEEPRNSKYRKRLRELDYAYAITVHKSQGSEWDHVIIEDDRMAVGDADFRRRWLYTAITRAKERLLVIQ